ncbi:MAG: adenylate cyclase [Planctomycetota bacterium]|nr:MAG: adenylate cyclase [Planctomycetota bacterium]
MGLEIERKFLLSGPAEPWRDAPSEALIQGYLCLDPERTVRVRLANGRGTLTVKGLAQGLTRREYEWEIPAAEAQELLGLCRPSLVEKTRFKLPLGPHLWEVDLFSGANEGLALAEVELSSEHESVQLPAWIGEEVSHDPRYTNAQLAQRPFGTWGAAHAG